MTDKQIADSVRELERYIERKDGTEHLGAAALAAMKLMAKCCHDANARTIKMTLSDCWFNDNPDDKSHYSIVIKKLKRKPNTTPDQPDKSE